MKHLLLLLMFLPELSFGQGPIGEWKDHLSFNSINRLAEMDETIAAATSNGILLVDKNGGKLSTLSKAEGLSDAGITAIAYSTNFKTLLIGYESGNLDLMSNNRIINFPDIAAKTTIPEKSILKMKCEGDFAYLCCSFGIVQLDLRKTEVANTWYIGSNQEPKKIYDLTSYGNHWYAATSKGIFRAEKENANLQDYRNWSLQNTAYQNDAAFTSFAQMEGLLFVHDLTNDRLLAFNGTDWQIKYAQIKHLKRIQDGSAGIRMVSENALWLVGKNNETSITKYQGDINAQKITPEDALEDSNNHLWIGDSTYGLILKSGTNFQTLLPNAPAGNHVTALAAGNDAIYAAMAEGLGETEKVSLSICQDGIWQNFSAADDEGLKSVRPITAVVPNTNHPGEYWASSAGSGLLYFKNNRIAAIYNDSNSSLGSLGGSCMVNGIALDPNNHLFYTNPTGKVRLGIRTATGNFVPLNYPGMNYTNLPTGKVLQTKSSTNWVVLPEEGLFAFRIKGILEDISDDLYRKVAVRSRFSNGTTSLVTQFPTISTVVEDLNGALWVGTGTGIVVYNNPDKIFDSGEFFGSQPSTDDGDGLFKPILEKEKITAIAVDGGNRKWLGSATSGLFLFTPDGDHMLQHFTTKNAPLPSNEILSIAIHPQSGELFVATAGGLVSYMGNATTGASDLKEAYVWPNPMRESYHGEVTIDGLTDGTEIRITDLAGNLIYKSSSLGGRARWNAKNSQGNRVATGIYLIFCTAPQLKTTKIIKLLVIH